MSEFSYNMEVTDQLRFVTLIDSHFGAANGTGQPTLVGDEEIRLSPDDPDHVLGPQPLQAVFAVRQMPGLALAPATINRHHVVAHAFPTFNTHETVTYFGRDGAVWSRFAVTRMVRVYKDVLIAPEFSPTEKPLGPERTARFLGWLAQTRLLPAERSPIYKG